MQYSINLTFQFIEALARDLFHVFTGEKKASEHIRNQTVPRVPQKFCDIKYPFVFLESFGKSSILTLSINLKLKVT